MSRGKHACLDCRHFRTVQVACDDWDEWCEARSGIENLRTWPFLHTDCEHWEPPKEKKP